MTWQREVEGQDQMLIVLAAERQIVNRQGSSLTLRELEIRLELTAAGFEQESGAGTGFRCQKHKGKRLSVSELALQDRTSTVGRLRVTRPRSRIDARAKRLWRLNNQATDDVARSESAGVLESGPS